MEISLESVISRFVPNSERVIPPSAQSIGQSVFENHEEIFKRYGITFDTLKLIPEKDGLTECHTRDGVLCIYWDARAIVPPPKYYSSKT